jgi:hypothetical protein
MFRRLFLSGKMGRMMLSGDSSGSTYQSEGSTQARQSRCTTLDLTSSLKVTTLPSLTPLSRRLLAVSTNNTPHNFALAMPAACPRHPGGGRQPVGPGGAVQRYRGGGRGGVRSPIPFQLVKCHSSSLLFLFPHLFHCSSRD